MFRLFDEARRAAAIAENPVARVKVPVLREVKKRRVILTEEETMAFFSCGSPEAGPVFP